MQRHEPGTHKQEEEQTAGTTASRFEAMLGQDVVPEDTEMGNALVASPGVSGEKLPEQEGKAERSQSAWRGLLGSRWVVEGERRAGGVIRQMNGTVMMRAGEKDR